jgi:type II secretory pathway pseudopilin PulG
MRISANPLAIGMTALVLVGFAAATALHLFSPVVPPARSAAAAQELARTAQMTMESYGLRAHGSFAGANAAALADIDTSINTRRSDGPAWLSGVTPDAAGVGYTVSVTAQTGGRFSIVRGAGGSLTFACTGDGSGCVDGSWR